MVAAPTAGGRQRAAPALGRAVPLGPTGGAHRPSEGAYRPVVASGEGS